MAVKKASAARSVVPSKSSSLPQAAPIQGVGKRYIVLYGPPKTRKTTGCVSLNARWLASDPNCLATLEERKEDFDPEKFYQCPTIDEAITLARQFSEIAREEGPDALDCEAIVGDSLTAWYDRLESDTPERANGFERWNSIISKLRELNDALSELAKFIHVILIAHAPAKTNDAVKKKGDWAILSLPGKSGEFFARSCNWMLFAGGEACEYQLQTTTTGVYIAAASSTKADLTEVKTSNVRDLLQAAGYLE